MDLIYRRRYPVISFTGKSLPFEGSLLHPATIPLSFSTGDILISPILVNHILSADRYDAFLFYLFLAFPSTPYFSPISLTKIWVENNQGMGSLAIENASKTKKIPI